MAAAEDKLTVMKTALLVVLSLSFLAPLVSQAQVQPEEPPRHRLTMSMLPSFLDSAVNSYIRSGRNASVAILREEYVPFKDREAFANELGKTFRLAEADFNRLVVVEPILVRNVSASYWQVFLLYGYEDGVLFVRYDIYDSPNGPKLVGYMTAREADAFLPPLREVVEL